MRSAAFAAGGPAALQGVWLQCRGKVAGLGIESGTFARSHLKSLADSYSMDSGFTFSSSAHQLLDQVLIFCLPTSEEDEAIVEQAQNLNSNRFGSCREFEPTKHGPFWLQNPQLSTFWGCTVAGGTSFGQRCLRCFLHLRSRRHGDFLIGALKNCA